MKHLFTVLFLCCSAAIYAAPTARLHWIGKTPATAKPVSFGIPFLKGEMKPTDGFRLTTDKGEVIAADFWPTAYWPDGSVKWGGFAAVVPGSTESVSFQKAKKMKAKGRATTGALAVSESDRQISINTGKSYVSLIPDDQWDKMTIE